MARLRTFIAVDLGKPIRDRLVGLQETLARSTSEVKWVEPENLHVSLLFLGEVDDREVPAMCKIVAECARDRPPFPLTVEGVGCFPHARRPRVLWAGIGAGASELIALHDALEPPLLALGCYRREDRPYTPHVTLGRVKGERASPQLGMTLNRKMEWQGGTTEVEQIQVLSSELTARGPIYAVLSRARLGAKPGK